MEAVGLLLWGSLYYCLLSSFQRQWESGVCLVPATCEGSDSGKVRMETELVPFQSWVCSVRSSGVQNSPSFLSSLKWLVKKVYSSFSVSLPFQEIIEFPILKLNGRTMEIESTFHMYVQPVVHPQLTPFCTEVRALERGSPGCWDRSFGSLVHCPCCLGAA